MSEPVPARGSIHLWWADLALSESEIASLHDLLSPVERDRAARLRTADSRRRFVGARGFLRTLLGNYLGQAPADVALTVGDHGKPRLAGPQPPLSFNVSHADDLAVYAFATDREVGVDVERIEAVDEWKEIATSYFEGSEAATISIVAETQRAAAFIGAWTRHEARLKLSGLGWSNSRPGSSTMISFGPIEPPAGFAAALAIAGPPAIVVDRGFL